jgi:predicted esterase
MEKKEYKLPVHTEMRYILLGEQEDTNHLIYVLHGYGQLAHYFSEKFAGFELRNTTFVFPEGLHRFYLQGSSGRVGASWMTKEWREHDIQVNIASLNKLHVELAAKLTPSKITVIGFSQGGATAARWLEDGLVPCDVFVSWASVFPPDLPMSASNPLAGACKFVIGNNDQFFPENEKALAIQQYQQLGFEIISYEGTHDIYPEICKQFIA